MNQKVSKKLTQKSLRESICNLKDQQVLVVGHDSPDGDCLASTFGLAYLLKRVGAKPILVNKDEVPNQYRFLLKDFKIVAPQEIALKDKNQIKTAIIVDAAKEDRIGFSLAEKFLGLEKKINIDHHISNDRYGDEYFVEQAGATAEIIGRLYFSIFEDMEPNCATSLYTGIMTDTGNLTYESTTEETVSLVARLHHFKADINLMRQEVYEKTPVKKIEALKMVLNNLELNQNGFIAYTLLTFEEIQRFNLSNGDMDGFVDYPRKISSCEIAMFFKEFEKDVFKVSVRTKKTIDANLLAKSFGGGGHQRAAGFRIRGEKGTVLKNVLEKIEEGLKNNEWNC